MIALEDFDDLGGQYHSDGVGHRWNDIRQCVIKAHQLKVENERLVAAARKVVSRHDEGTLSDHKQDSTSIEELRAAAYHP